MECPICFESYDPEVRRPKCLPCGHTFCQDCVANPNFGNQCPQDRKDFTGPVHSLADNFAILGLVDKKPAPSLKLWCRDCSQAAAASCADHGHALCSLLKLRAEQAAPQLQRLRDAVAAAQKAVLALQNAKTDVETLLQQWRDELQHAQDAERKLQAAVDGGADLDLEAGRPGDQQLLEAVGLVEGLEPKCGLYLKDGSQWTGDVGGSHSLLDALVLQLHHRGCVAKAGAKQEPAQLASALQQEHETAEVAPPPRNRIREIDVGRLSLFHSGSRSEKKEALLARVREHGVRRMKDVRCCYDPAWTLALLHSASPTLKELRLVWPREEHLRAAHSTPGLRRLELICEDGDLDDEALILPPLPRGRCGLKWLFVEGLPRPALFSLLRAHCASLEELRLVVGTPGGGQWPDQCSDLDVLLSLRGLARLRVSKVVLLRYGSVTHRESDCPAQLSALKRVLPDATVLCEFCDDVD